MNSDAHDERDDDDAALPTAPARGPRPPRHTGAQRFVDPTTRPVRSLRIHRPDAAAVAVGVDVERRYVVGRHDAADLAFDAVKVSRVHGTLFFDEARARWTFQDAGSSNGTTLRRGPVEVRAEAGTPLPLQCDDVLLIGDRACRIELVADEPAPAATVGVTSTPRSAATRALANALEIASKTKAPVFLLGPSGCGKTHAASELHRRSKLAGAFIAINCARLSTDASTLHSELLGHRRGAFTNAHADREGAFFAADGGTLLLDEVDSLAPAGQGFLLDVLEGRGAPLGASAKSAARPPEFRLVSASKVPLGASGLRHDLCERIGAGHLISIPGLDERAEDIPALIESFLDEARRLTSCDLKLSSDALALASGSAWPGHVRQLRATIATLAQIAAARVELADESGTRRAVIERADLEQHMRARATAFAMRAPTSMSAAPAPADAPGDVAQQRDAPQPPRGARVLTADEVKAALARNNHNQSAAARELGIARNTLIKKMRDFNLV